MTDSTFNTSSKLKFVNILSNQTFAIAKNICLLIWWKIYSIHSIKGAETTQGHIYVQNKKYIEDIL